MKVFICCKTLSLRMQIQVSAFLNQKLIARGDLKKSAKIIKVLCVKCAPVTGIAKGIVTFHSNRCVLVRHGDMH